MKQYYIGIGQDAATQTKLKNMASRLGTEHYEADSDDLDDVFDKIASNLGLTAKDLKAYT